MQVFAVFIALFALAFISSSGGLAPEGQFSLVNSDRGERVAEAAGSESPVNNANYNSNNSRQNNESSRQVIEDLRTPLVQTYSARNIEDDSALIRADIDMYSHKGGAVYVVYGYNKARVESLAESELDFDRRIDTADDRARVKYIDLNPREQESYEERVNRLVTDADYYYQVCVEYGASTRVCSPVETFSTNPEASLNNRFQTPRISAGRALYVTAGEASIAVNLRMNDGRDGVPFFVYGLYEDFVDEIDDEYSSYSSIREYEEDLQKIRLGVRRLGRSEYEVNLDDLIGDSKYFYRACIEYDGWREGMVCDNTKSFETDSRNQNRKPFVATNIAEIKSNGIQLSGRVRMNDFIDGYAFFVYGTDFEKVKRVPGDNSFTQIRQSVDQLQKIVVDDDVDSVGTFSVRVKDLQTSQLYHYRMCVQYVDENKYGREEFFINCGDMRSFVGY